MSLDDEYEFKYPIGLFKFSAREKDDKAHELIFFNVPLRSGMVVLMDFPNSFVVHNHVSISVLSGHISVFGYEITPRDTPIEVFSSEKTGLLEVKTETYELLGQKYERCEELEKTIYNITRDKKKTHSILTKLGNLTVIVYVERRVFSNKLRHLSIYFPNALKFKKYSKVCLKNHQYSAAIRAQECIHFNSQEREVADKILAIARKGIGSGGQAQAPRVVVIGPKNTGKSTMLRFLINKFLSSCLTPYYLDADPGQAEFTPPGVVSLTKVKDPLLGPPFCHPRDPNAMVFIGSISGSNIDVYTRSIAKLLKVYNNCSDSKGLFVSTMGWMKGLGLEFLKNVMALVKPDVLIELVESEDAISMFDYRPYTNQTQDFLYTQLCIQAKKSSTFCHFSARELREMNLLSYFGQCQSEYLDVQPLNELRPYVVPWDNIPIYVAHEKVAPYRIVESVNLSIVALCTVRESDILESEIPEFQMTLVDEPDNICRGFGFVRSIDEKKRLLHIVTPLKSNIMAKVNAIMTGDITVPKTILLNQDIDYAVLPYLVEKGTESDEDEELNDISLVSVQPKEEEQEDDEEEKTYTNSSLAGSAKKRKKTSQSKLKRPKRK